MGLESATFIHELDATNPVGATDPKAQGDDHLRMVKATLQATFPNIEGAVTATHTQLNAVGASGITGFAAPTNDVGSAAQSEGVATTALRSDATLQINLTADYVWTGEHSFALNKLAVNGSDFNGLANSSASIGLTANNGSATTAMRSDATPALSQAIVPTWTGQHTFSSGLTSFRTGANPLSAFAAFSDAADELISYIGWVGVADAGVGGATRGDFIIRTNASDILFSTDNGGSAAVIITDDKRLFVDGIETGYRGVPLLSNDSDAYAFVLADRGKSKTYTGSGGHTFTLPSGTTEGDTFVIDNMGTGNLTIAAPSTLSWLNGSGAISTGSRTLAVAGSATCRARGGNTFTITGVGLS